MKILSRVDHNIAVGGTASRHPPPGARQRAARSDASQASVVELGATAQAPALYGANGVLANTVAPPSPDFLVQLRQRLSDEYPALRPAAKQAIEANLKSRYGVAVDADRTWFNTFASGHSSARTYNGWEHLGTPLTSLSLTDLQLQNLAADFGEDPNVLDANSGVYRDDASASRFGVGNEVRLLSSELKTAIRDSDFQASYRARLEAYWARNESAVALHYEALALEHSVDGQLSLPARTLLAQAAGHHDSDGAGCRAYAFDIDGYLSKNMAWLQGADGRVVLLSPQGTSPVREYANLRDMRQDIAALARTSAGRDELQRGFSLYNQQDGIIYQGVDKWLADIAAGGYEERIAMQPQGVPGNVFADMAARTRAASLDDVSRLIRSNADIGEQELLQALHAFNDILGNPLTTLGEAGYALYAAHAEGFAADRRDAATQAWAAGLNAAVMLLLDGGGRRLKSLDLAAQKSYYKPPTRLPDGRLGYPLSPIGSPRLPATDALPGSRPGPSRSLSLHPRSPTAPVVHPDPEQALDLRRHRTPSAYREPDTAFSDPRADLPLPEGDVMLQALDLSRSSGSLATAEPPVRSLAGASAAVAAGHPGTVGTSVHVNARGFMERRDFANLYGFQSIGGRRMARTVAGIELDRNRIGIAPMIEGDMLRTFTTIEAAHQAAARAYIQRYEIYHINATGLRGASFSDNHVNNPQFESLLLQLTPAADDIPQHRRRTALRLQLLREAEKEVHLSAEGLSYGRVTFIIRRIAPR